MGSSCEGCCPNGEFETDANTVESPQKKERKKRNNNNTTNEIAGSSSLYKNKNRKESVSSKSTPIDNDSDFITDEDYPTEDASTTYDMDNNNNSDDEFGEESSNKIISGFKNAIKNGNDSLVMQLVEEYAALELLELTFENGDNALHVAVRNSAHNLILYLLTNGVSPNAQNEMNGETALHTAVMARDVNVVTLLIKFKADPMIGNKNYQTPLALATENGDEDIIELLSPEAQEIVIQTLATDYASAKDDNTEATPDLNDDNDDYNTNDDDNNLEREQEENKEKEKGDSEVKLNVSKKKKSIEKPFAKLKRVNTRQALDAIHDITSEKNNLPTLEAWLEKKQDHMPYQWQRRWVIVRDSHILWSDIQRSIKDPKNAKERKKFNNSISLMTISEVKPVTKKSKSQRKFIIVVGRGKGTKKREYLWKCSTKDDRDNWVKGLQSHINHMHSIKAFLRGKN